MKKPLILLIFFLSILILFSPVKALDVIAANGSAVSIQIAVNQVNASGGGTVYIPEGDFLFNPTEDGAVKIPGGVNLIGAGKDKTILRNIEPVPFANWSWGYFFFVDGSKQNGKAVHLSNFTIIGFRELYPNNESRTKGIYIRQVKDFVVSNVKIKDVGGGGISVVGWRSYGDVITRGVITHCDFINTNGLPMGPGAIASGPNVLGYGVQVDGFGIPGAWIDDISQVLGKYDYGQPVVYIEDSYFSRWRHCIASNQVGHYVSRYNIFDNYTQGFGDVDAHGAGYGTHGTGTRAIEVYNNTFMTPTPAGSWTMATVFHRGGGGVYFNNTVKSGRRNFVYFTNDGTDWNPRSDVEKYFTNDVWIWNNNISSGVTEVVKYDPEGLINEGVNYHLNAPTFTYMPYPYPHPLTLEVSSLNTISGRLLDKNNNPVNANIVAYLNGTNTIINSAQTNSSGHYSLQVPNGTYNIQFNLTNFFIPNFFIKLNSINIDSNLQNLVNNITDIGNQNVSFTVNANSNQTIQTYSIKKPLRVLINGTIATEVSSSQLTNNTWYFESNSLYIKNPTFAPSSGGGGGGGCACNNWTNQGCSLSGCASNQQYQTRTCSPAGCSVTTQCVYNTSCFSSTADYYVLESNSIYYAINGSNQQTFLSDTNAATLINNVLNMMKSGQKVAFQGTFSLLSTIRPKSNTTLLFGTATFTVDATVSNLMTLSSGANNITFDGGFFDAKRNCSYFINGYGYNSITVQNGDYQRFTAAVLSFQQSGSSQDNHLIQYNNFHGATTGTYVDLNFASNCRVLRNTFDGPSEGDHALGVFSPSDGYNEIAYNKMVNSTGHEIYTTTPNMMIHDNELGAGLGDGCVVKAKSFIYNNYVHDRGAWGITLYWWEAGTSAGDPAGSRIYNNRIENTLDALVIRPTRHVAPELNVTITDVEYTNNTISGGNGAAFRFTEIGYQAINITFQYNMVSNKPYGARIDASSSLINGIKFLKNTFISVPTPFSIGAGVSDTTIAYNDVTQSGATLPNMLQDSGTNTMVYDNIPTSSLPDKNVPPDKIPPPP